MALTNEEHELFVFAQWPSFLLAGGSNTIPIPRVSSVLLCGCNINYCYDLPKVRLGTGHHEHPNGGDDWTV